MILDLLTTHTCAARGRLPYGLTSTPSTAAAARTTTTYDERQVVQDERVLDMLEYL